jgi:hypothetical protein
MATSVITHLLDDLEGGDASTSVPFTWGGVQYEIDLNDKNAAAFEKAVARYVGAARRVGGRATTPRASKAAAPVKAKAAKAAKAPKAAKSGKAVDTSSVREWATKNGYEVSARGRLSSVILEAFKAAS